MSKSGALELLFATFWHNGLDLSEGMPRCLPLAYTAGVLNVHIKDKQVDILIDSQRQEEAGEGLTLLRQPAGLSRETRLDGTPALRGMLPADGLRLEYAP